MKPASPEQVLFAEALQRTTPEARTAYLDGACGTDMALRRRVEALLRAAENAGDFLELPPTGLSGDADATSLVSELSENLGDRIGRYKLLEKIGEGGMGVVYMAEQEEPVRRRVALKLIKLGMDTKSVVARFEAEGQALALMDHPNIAKVFDVGATATGRPYLVMELVRGIKITTYCDQHRLSTRERLELCIKACHALQHAHQKGIIHRDLKPSNILVTVNDGVPVPKVIDFGIAKAIAQKLTDKTLFTEFQALVGTPAYMSPEQVDLSSVDIDTRSDIYALGVLLYHVLTGKTPFDGKELLASGIDAMRKTIREQEPVRPSTRLATLKGEELTTTAGRRSSDGPELVRLLKGDLDWIVMKCLEKDRARRYDTASGLARDIERHLGNEPVMARPPSTAYRLHKAWRRHKLAFAAGTSIVASLALGLGLAALGLMRARSERDQAVKARSSATANEQRARQAESQAKAQELAARHQLAQQYLRRGQMLCEQGQLLRGLHWLARGLGEVPPESASLRAVILQNLTGWAGVWTPPKAMLACDSPTLIAAISPDGKRAAAADVGGLIQFWSLETGEVVGPAARCGGEVNVLEFSPDGSEILAASEESGMRLYSTETGDSVGVLLRRNASGSSGGFSRDGTRIATGQADGTVRLWHRADGALIGAPMKHDRPGRTTVLFSADPESALLLSTGGDGTARIWNSHTGEPCGAPIHPEGGLVQAVFVGHGTKIATAGSDDMVRFWGLSDGRPLGLPIHHGGLTSWAVSPDGERVLMGGNDGTVRLWDAMSGKLIREQLTHQKRVTSVVFHPRKPIVFTGSRDGTVRLWSARTGEPVGRAFYHDAWVAAIHLAPNAETALTQTFAQPLGVWPIPEGQRQSEEMRSLPNTEHGCSAFSADGQSLWFTQDGRKVSRWSVNTGEVKPTAVNHPGTIWSLALSPDQNHLLTTGVDGTARLWSVGREEKLLCALAHNGQVRAGIFSSNGRMLATASFDRTARLWSAPSGDPLRSFPHPGMVEDVAFSPDGTLVATACGDGGARLWSVRAGQRVGPVLRHHGSVLTVKFNPTGTGLVTGGRDRTVRFWDVATGRPGPVLEHGGWVEDLVLANEGRSLVTADAEGGIRWWDVATGEVLGPPLEQSGGYWHLALSTDGRRIAAGSSALPLTIWTVPTSVPSSLANAELWVQVLTWHEMDPNGALRPLDRTTWLARRAELETHRGAGGMPREKP